MKFYYLLFLGFLILISCKNEETFQESKQVVPAVFSKNKSTKYITNIDYLRMRDKPGEDGTVISMLNQGDTLIDLGEQSEFKTKVKLRGLWTEETWLKVAKNDSIKGWVYAGGLGFIEPTTNNPIINGLVEDRLVSLFGKDLANSIKTYKKAYKLSKSSKDFALAFTRGEGLRDSLLPILHEKIEIVDPEKMPDLSWLEMAMPAYKTQLVAEGTLVHLFMNYKEMFNKAVETSGSEDDEFIDLCFEIYAIDSLEHFYPSWFIQTWDYGGHSELGSGKHISILKKMNRLLAESSFFESKTEKLKVRLLNDITNAEVTYWNTQAEILEELESILEAEFGILTDEDKMSLQVRKKMFQSADENSIQLNHRAGIHDL